MEKFKINKLNSLKMFYATSLNTFIFSLKKFYLHVFGILYLLIGFIFLTLTKVLHKSLVDPNYRAWMIMMNILLLFLLFIFIMLLVIYFFHTHKKNGFFKIEQREVVPLITSFMARSLNVYLFSVIYEIVLIITTNLMFIGINDNNQLKNAGLFNFINLQPLISIFIIGLLVFIVTSLKIVSSVFFITIIAIVYSISPICSMFALDSNGNISKITNNIEYLTANASLGKSFYKYSSENKMIDSMYDSNFLNVMSELNVSDKNNKAAYDINQIDYLYSNSSSELLKNLFAYGDISEIIDNDKNLEIISKWNFFINFIKPVYDDAQYMSSDNSLYKDYFIQENSIFNANFDLNIYLEFLNNLLISDSIKNNFALKSIVSFMKDNIEILINTYISTMRNGLSFDGTYETSSIPLGLLSDNNFIHSNGLKKNYMLNTLIWEMTVYYNLSLSPVLMGINKIKNYNDIKNYSSNWYNSYDSLMITNHLYTFLNYSSSSMLPENIRANSYLSNPFTSKCILKPYKVMFQNDEVLSDLLINENLDLLNPYSKSIDIVVSKNLNIIILRIMYIFIGFVLFTFAFLIFRFKIKQ